MSEFQITMTERAQQVLNNQRDQVRAASRTWHEHQLDAVLKMEESLIHCYSSIFTNGFGDARIIGSDDLSLEIHTGITIGMVFFRKDRPDMPLDDDKVLSLSAPMMGRYCYHYIAGIGYCQQPIVNGEHPEHAEHAPDVYSVPMLGEWSLHS